ncbi:rhodanese-like domain-containing protein [Paracoccus sanguinis]|uniref:Rhodanese-related sulfurtransferase n=1 Tax=Paracoccus sanguinis TaxID=1545044 RepID=A0A1H2T8C5_9RHOB|nr:Rhodanese-related sulfurtransferase [Paracoccus sanguinis]
MTTTLIRSAAVLLLTAATAPMALAQATPAPAAPAEAPAATPEAAPAPPQGAPRVGITRDMAEAVFKTPDGEFTIRRDQTPGARLEGDWALTSMDCPPFCIQPMSPAPGVTTVGELELIEAMKAGDTILVDGRTPDWFTGGTIPGAINIPYTQAVERLSELGCEPDFDGKFDCAEAKKAILFCNGIWCGQSPTAIRAMIDAGYPAEKISYYRGGMLTWRLLGLTVAGGANAADTDPVAAQEVTPEEAATPGAGAASGAKDGVAQNAGQKVNDGVMTPAENPLTNGTAAEAAKSGETSVTGDATAAKPGDAAAQGGDATTGNPSDTAAPKAADSAAPKPAN